MFAPRDMRSFFVVERLREQNTDSTLKVIPFRRTGLTDPESVDMAKSPVRFYHVRADILRMQAAKREIGGNPQGLRRVRDLESEVRYQIDTWIEEFVAAMNSTFGYIVDAKKCVFFNPFKDQNTSAQELLSLRQNVLAQYEKALDYLCDPHLIARTQIEYEVMAGLHRRWSNLKAPALFMWNSAPPRQRGEATAHQEERVKQGFGEDMHSFLYYAVPEGKGKARVYATTLVHQLSEAHAADFLREYVVKGGEDGVRVGALSEIPDDLELLRLPVQLDWNISQMDGVDGLYRVAQRIEALLESNATRNMQFPVFYDRQKTHRLARISSRVEMQEIHAEAQEEIDAYIEALRQVQVGSVTYGQIEYELKQKLLQIWLKRKAKYAEIKFTQQIVDLERILERPSTEFEQGMVWQRVNEASMVRAQGVQCAEMKLSTKVMVKKMVDGKEVWVEEEEDVNKLCELKCRCGRVYYLKTGESKDKCDSCGWDGSEETRHVLADQIKLDKFESQVEKPLRVIKNSEGWTNAKTEKKVMTNEDVALSPIIVDFQTGERVYTIGFAVIRRMLPLQERLKLLKTHQVRYMAA